MTNISPPSPARATSPAEQEAVFLFGFAVKLICVNVPPHSKGGFLAMLRTTIAAIAMFAAAPALAQPTGEAGMPDSWPSKTGVGTARASAR